MKNLFLLLGLLIPIAGCGGNEPTEPGDDELSNYVDENPSDFTGNEDIESSDVGG